MNIISHIISHSHKYSLFHVDWVAIVHRRGRRTYIFSIRFNLLVSLKILVYLGSAFKILVLLEPKPVHYLQKFTIVDLSLICQTLQFQLFVVDFLNLLIRNTGYVLRKKIKSGLDKYEKLVFRYDFSPPPLK